MNTAPTANERLMASREQLRHALRQIGSESDPHSGLNPSTWPTGWRAHLKRSVPEASVLLDLLERWWMRQPLRVTCLLATEAATVVLQPVAQRHPYPIFNNRQKTPIQINNLA